jgi:TonB family protein
MKKSNMFFVMLSLSAAFHGLILFSVARSGFRTSSPILENRFIPTTIKVVQTETALQENTPGKPQEKNVIEQAIEALPEPVPVQRADPQETDRSEEVVESRETPRGDDGVGHTGEFRGFEGDAGNTGEAGEGRAGGSGAAIDRSREALLAYIKDFIDKNLAYPTMAQRRNIQGVVGVYFEIGENGELISIVVDRSSGSSILDNAAVMLVKKIRPLENITIERKLALNVNIDYKLTE